MAIRQEPRSVFARALKELSKKKPLDNITVQEIAELSGYSRKNFYYYFQDKYDLVEWYFNYEGDMIVEENAERSWQHILAIFLLDIKKYPRYYSDLFSEKNSFPMTDSYFSFIVRSMSDYMKEQDIEINEDLRFYLRYVAYASVRIVRDWLDSGCPVSPSSLASKLISAYPEAIRPFFN